MVKRFRIESDGFLVEHARGPWCHHADVSKVVDENDRLRAERDRLGEHAARSDEAYQRLLDKLEASEARVAELERDRHEYVVKLDALREQVHEQAIAGREDGKLIEELKAAVAELEREWRRAEVGWSREQTAHNKTKAALDQARVLLERWNKLSGPTCEVLQEDTWDWLRAHPEPTTPAATGAEPAEPARRADEKDQDRG